ncbi:hypothetical protein ANRL3_02107 [Anaerolineae bacterium]|nr:hypothetical protein ANRL3_02107 [Anaerolineae bacterium]
MTRGKRGAILGRIKILTNALAGVYQEKVPDMILWTDYIRKRRQLQVIRPEKTRGIFVLGGRSLGDYDVLSFMWKTNIR